MLSIVLGSGLGGKGSLLPLIIQLLLELPLKKFPLRHGQLQPSVFNPLLNRQQTRQHLRLHLLKPHLMRQCINEF